MFFPNIWNLAPFQLNYYQPSQCDLVLQSVLEISLTSLLNSISRPSVEISPVWHQLIRNEMFCTKSDLMKIRSRSTAGNGAVWIVSVSVCYDSVWGVYGLIILSHSSYYGFDGFNLWCVSGAILGGLAVVFNFSVALFLLGATYLKTEAGPASET